MVDRSQPLVVTPPACPFVALDGDRDQRHDAPDPMHRCFAEAQPRSRSMGHQANFCLTPAFTGCTIFLDWASRVAADVVAVTPVGVGVGVGDGTAAVATSDLPAVPRASSAQAPTTSTDLVQRPWAASPPWVAEAALPADPLAPSNRTARLDIDTAGGPGAMPDGSTDTGTVTSATATAVAAVPVAGALDADAGDAAELAASMARTDLTSGGVVASGSTATDAISDDAEDGEPEVPPWSRGRPRVPIDAGAPSSLAPQTRPGTRPQGAREWEGARRFEAYAARTGSRRPGRPVLIAIGAGLVAVAVLVVFLLPSLFMGAGATPTATPDAVASGLVATERPVATPDQPAATPDRPEATPRSYRVKSGDTLLRLGRRFNVTVEQLMCANGIKNANSLSVGVTLVIPIESYDCPKPTKRPQKTPRG